MQTVGIKTCRFSLFSLVSASLNVQFLNFWFWEDFPDSFMQKSLFFNTLSELESR